MYSYLNGTVAYVEARKRGGGMIVTVQANGLGIPVRVYAPWHGLNKGDAAEHYLLCAYSDREGYTFYGFESQRDLQLAKDIHRNVNGVGPDVITALIHGVSYHHLLRAGKGDRSITINVAGAGAKKMEALMTALKAVFKDVTIEDTLGDNLEPAIAGALTVLGKFGVRVEQDLLAQFAVKLPAEEVSVDNLVKAYLDHIRKG